MLLNKNFSEILKVYSHYKLKERDVKYQESANYSASLPWMHHIALYKQGEISRTELKDFIKNLVATKPKFIYTNITQEDLMWLTKTVLKTEFIKLELD